MPEIILKPECNIVIEYITICFTKGEMNLENQHCPK